MKIFAVARIWALALAAIVLAGPGSAQNFPTRHITLIVPYAAGGPTDTYGRLVAEGMSRHLGQQVIIENIGGAGGTIGTGKVAVGAADGYTLLINQVGLPIGAALYPKLNHDVLRDLQGVGLINYGPTLMIGRKDLPFDDLAGLAKWVKEQGRVVKFAHAGAGSFAHMCSILVADAYKMQADLVPYRGGGPALNDVIAGHVDLNCASLVAGEQVRSGLVKGLAIAGKERSAAVPNVQTFAEAGFPQLDLTSWHGLYVRAGTPPAVLEKLNAALKAALTDEKVTSAFARTGVIAYPPAQQTPEAAMELLRSEHKRWGDVIRAHNIAPPG